MVSFLFGRTLKKLVRPTFYLILSAVFVILAINVYVFSFSSDFILESAGPDFKSPFDVPEELKYQISESGPEPASEPVQYSPATTAILLGASVYSSGQLSPLLEERAETALELYRSGKVRKILVTGDNSTPMYNEVLPTREYLLKADVPAEDIFVDFAGFNTYDSVYRAREIFGVDQAFVVSQGFHLPRAVFAARKIGLNAYGVPAGEGRYLVKNNIREVFAIAKTFFEVVLGLDPHFLGPNIPIEGDGRGSLE